MQLGLSESLSTLVAKRFTAAKEGSHLVFSSTQLANIQASGIPYQLRYCPALAKKPSAIPKSSDQDQTDQPKPKPDPFENPATELLIATIPQPQGSSGGHRLVLNKFPIIPNHFILATKEWKAQTDLLERGDLEATYTCIKAWESGNGDNSQTHDKPGKRLFAFFNSGSESGASQPHRHLQFLPVEAMAEQQQVEGSETSGSSSSWRPLIDAVFESKSESEYRHLDKLPFAHFALPLPPNPSADTLHAIYLSLYRAAVSTVKAADGGNVSHAGDADTPGGASASGPAAISYNLAMTESAMMICPRCNETAQIYPPGSDDAVVGSGVIALNGTILAGTLMVKAEAEWNELRRDPEVLTGALSTVGYAPGLGRASL